MQIVHKASVLKAVRDKGQWEGRIAPSNLRPGGPWNLGIPITIIPLDTPKTYAVLTYSGDPIPLQEYLNTYEVYNCSAECGRRVRFWED